MFSSIGMFFSGIKAWLYAAAAAGVALLFGYAEYERHGKQVAEKQVVTGQAEQAAADAQTQLSHVETRDAVQAQVESTPKPPADPQLVATAPPGSAAGRLRDRWSRD